MEIDPTELIHEGDYWLGQWANRFQICSNITICFHKRNRTTPSEKTLWTNIQTVIDYDKDRDCMISWNDYCDIVEKVWYNAGGIECMSSIGTHENMQFISDFIVALAEKETGVMLIIKRDKLKKLKEEVQALEKEIE